MIALVGELAALGTALCWAFTSIWFAAASRRVGALPVNFVRMPIALVYLALWGLFTRGHALPFDASAHAWTWLTASALAGFAFGDLCLFRAFVLIGPRLGSLVMASAPPITALLGWLALGEQLDARQLAGMAATTAGIAIAIRERRAQDAQDGLRDRGALTRGVVLALGGALGQASGLVLAKHGMGDYDPFAATQIRVIVGLGAFAVMVTAARAWPAVGAAIRDRRALGLASLGATFGPFLGVALSLLAAQNTATGVAASLMAVQPLLVIPLAVWLHGERVGKGALVGAALAVLGVALLVQ
ncbi:MAG: DMT family transporter [Nannocystaceae bacterium]|nr:DMT family transporter [Nannocystaceae bacterium]